MQSFSYGVNDIIPCKKKSSIVDNRVEVNQSHAPWSKTRRKNEKLAFKFQSVAWKRAPGIKAVESADFFPVKGTW